VPSLLVGLALLTAVPANAEETAPAATPPSTGEAGAEATGAAEMAGREIYEKVLDNRFDAYTQDLVMSSGDRGGNIQDTKMAMKYLNYREMDKRIISKSIMKYHAPQDVRHLGYLVINKVDGSEDQFVYRPSSRRVRRINLRGEAIFGTDFAFEDIIPQELENATYARKPDSELNGIPVHVVEVTPVEEQDSEYSKFDVYVTQDTFATFLETASRFDGRSHVRTWLFGILYKKISEARRRTKPRPARAAATTRSCTGASITRRS
jgi:hypothetical protein